MQWGRSRPEKEQDYERRLERKRKLRKEPRLQERSKSSDSPEETIFNWGQERGLENPHIQ